MNSTNRYPCPCCGYQTLSYPAHGAMEICPVCFWEDAPGEYPYNSSNSISLREAQINFLEFGAAEREHLDIVRNPVIEESRLSDWMSADDLRARVLTMIHSSFGEVLLESGVSLHQAEAIDDYADSKQIAEARKLDPEIHWHLIPKFKLERFHGSLVFYDPKGFRFYLPAFMVHALESFNVTNGNIDADGVLFAACDTTGHDAENWAILDTDQRETVAAFLQFISLYTEYHSTRDADKALETCWDKHLPDFLKKRFS